MHMYSRPVKKPYELFMQSMPIDVCGMWTPKDRNSALWSHALSVTV